MRHLLLPLAILLLPAVPALAQVTVDLRALDALPNRPGPSVHRPPASTAVARPPARATARHAAPATTARLTTGPAATAQPTTAQPTTAQPTTAPPTTAPSAAPTVAPGTATATRPTPSASAPSAASTPQAAPPQPPPATIAAAPPALAIIPPVQPPPSPANAAAPPPPPVVANAGTTAATTTTGLRLTFDKGQSDLSPTSAETIKNLVQTAPHTDTTTYNVLAYASGDPDDPSVARRLSLARALAVRAALLADGVSSARIYLRALGSQPGGGSPDRVEVNVLGGNSATAAQQ